MAYRSFQLFLLIVVTTFLALCGCNGEESADQNEPQADNTEQQSEDISVNAPPVIEPVADDDPESVKQIEDMYGEYKTNDDGNVTFVDFTGAFGEPVDLSIMEGLPSVEHLIVIGKSVTGDDALENLSELTRLRVLNVSESGVTNEGMQHLAKIKSLEDINLQRTNITDAGLKTLLEIPSLKRLRLVRCKITDEGLSFLKDRTNLEMLDVKECIGVSDDGMAHLVNLKRLRFLRVWGSKISDAGLKHVEGLSANSGHSA